MVREQFMEIIAEIGQYHNGDIKLAKELIYAAKENGASVAKFQIFNAKKLFTKKNNPWYQDNLQAELSIKDILTLNEICKKVEIEFMASVFDTKLLKVTEKIKMKRYKVASRSVFDKRLVNKILSFKKPTIISLGFWNKKYFPFDKTRYPISYLYCVSKYPTLQKDLILSKKLFKIVDGFSDHTVGLKCSIKAINLGAKIIEKHFTMDKKLRGPDHKLSITPKELKILSEYSNSFKN